MSNEAQIQFIKYPYGQKYKMWASGVDELYSLYENDHVQEIEELTVFQYRITRNNKKFDWYPMGRRLFNLQTKQWHTVKVLKSYLN